ncbi:uncharacterized protein [Aegilops tauschii subsp. strangulata]|uniref:uncharacterized protein n=1 Tax=Aegilops tauschii subsp. strangulata TaxID=200361 RepID=UPI003CC8B756
MTSWKRFVKARMVAVSSPSAAACAESAAAYFKSAAASALSAAASAERAAAAVETTANTENTRAAICAADVALARVEAIHAKIEDAHAKIFQATSESSMQPTSEKVTVAMEHLLPHEIVEREPKMQEAEEIEERREEELRVAEVEVEKSPFIEELAVEYQRELWRSHYYEYYNLKGGAEDEDEDAVDFSRGDAESTNGGMSLIHLQRIYNF